MEHLFHSKPYLVAIAAGLGAQTVKVISFLLLEKRLNFRRFVETDGTPNMHSAAFAGLTLYVGLVDGFGSLNFTLGLCVTVMTSVDIWNVKRAHHRHAELTEMILDRLQTARGVSYERSRKALSYTPIDVLSGTALGMAMALLAI